MNTEKHEGQTPESAPRRIRRKHLLWIIPAAAAVLLIGVWFGVTFAVENVARRRLADISLRLIGQEVTPEDVSFSLAERELRISGIRIPNPPGYSWSTALEVELIRAKAMPWALLRRVVHLENLTISGILICVELKKVPRNLSEWLDLLEKREINLLDLKRAASLPDRGGTRKGKSGSGRIGEPLRFRIDELHVEEAVAALGNLKVLPAGWTLTVVDGCVQKDLGREKPLTADELVAEIFDRHWRDIKRYCKKTAEGVKRDLKEKAEEIKEKAKEMKKLVKEKIREKAKEKPASVPLPSATPARQEDEAAKEKKRAARKEMLKQGGRVAAELLGEWAKRKKRDLEEKSPASDDPEENRKARRRKRLLDLTVSAAEAVQGELEEVPAAPPAAPAEGSGEFPAQAAEQRK